MLACEKEFGRKLEQPDHERMVEGLE